MSFNKLNRSTHKWASIIIAVPFLVIIVTGILLLLKKEVAYIQPPSAKGTLASPSIEFDRVLAIAKTVQQAGIHSWEDINRLDVRPSKGIIKVRAESSWEIQLDATTGDILHVAFRRSDIIEKLHDASYWQDNANLWFTLPLAVALLLISITGIILFFQPYYRRYKRK
jgi:uncharacterized iron-regulated membrane protein